MRSVTKRLMTAGLSIAVVGLVYRTGISEDKKEAPGMDPAMMEAMMKAATPGEHHALLAKMAGHYKAECTMRMGPDAPEITSKGEEHSEMVFDGRYLKSDFTGDMMGKPFHGMALVGYDNTKQKYVSIWVDDMSTSPMVSEGTADKTGKVVTYQGEMECPGMEGKMSYRNVITIVDHDHYTMEMFQKAPDGKEFTGMTIKYERVK